MASSSDIVAHARQPVRLYRQGVLEWRVFCDNARLVEVSDPLLRRISIPAMHPNECFDLVDVSLWNDLAVIVVVVTIPQPGTISIRALPIPELDDDFRCSWVDQLQATRDSYKSFVNWAGELIPEAKGGRRTLLIKVQEGQTWFLKFPLASFSRLKIGEFSKYDQVHWILSERSFSDTVEKRRELLQLLSDTTALLDGTIVLINKYRKQIEGQEGSALDEGFRLIEELVSQYKDVSTENGVFTLRAMVSPSRDGLTEALRNPKTKIVLGAFEADSGDWQLSDWPNCDNGKQYFKLEQLAGQLKHIALLRIFHCNALVPGGGASSIVSRLLHSGAQIVEGGLTEESYFEFQDAVLRFFFQTPLYHTLEVRDFSGEFSLSNFTARCNNFLLRNGFPEIGAF